MSWSKRQAKDIVKSVKRRYGAVWTHVSDDVRGALLAQDILGVVIGQNAETLKTEAIEALWVMVRKEAGLWTATKEVCS